MTLLACEISVIVLLVAADFCASFLMEGGRGLNLSSPLAKCQWSKYYCAKSVYYIYPFLSRSFQHFWRDLIRTWGFVIFPFLISSSSISGSLSLGNSTFSDLPCELWYNRSQY
jgi:hypothetical protein